VSTAIYGGDRSCGDNTSDAAAPSAVFPGAVADRVWLSATYGRQPRLALSDDGKGDESVRTTAPGTSDAISLMESKIWMNLPTTKFLKGAFKLLHVSGLVNELFAGKVSAKMFTI
jgi:hypothetical protein